MTACPACGNELGEDSFVCPHCGERLRTDPSFRWTAPSGVPGPTAPPVRSAPTSAFPGALDLPTPAADLLPTEHGDAPFDNLGPDSWRPLIGRVVAGKFEIVSLIGEGGMGKVYKARHLALDKLVCVKILRRQLLENPTTVTRFEREAKSASRLHHPNSIQVLDFGRLEEGGFYIVMEYVDGRDLAVLLQQEWPLSEIRICHIISQVLSALAAAHAAQVIHRDLKPENIMLERLTDDSEFVKVLDFGIAKVLADDEPGLTRADLLCGTPQYMSPEQSAGGAIDGRSDLYAVGIMLYRMTTGVLPFDGPTPVEILNKQLHEDPLPPRQRRPDLDISLELDRLIVRALSKDPALRPQTAEQFRRDLLEIEAARRLETSGGFVVPGRSADTSRAITIAVEEPDRMLDLPEPAVVVDPKAGRLETAPDLSEEITARRRIKRAQRFQRAALLVASLAIACAALGVGYAKLPAEWKVKAAEEYDHLVRGQKLGEGDRSRPPTPDPHTLPPPDARLAREGDRPNGQPPAIVAAAPTSDRCLPGSILIADVDEPYCIDQYEFPNVVGVLPWGWYNWSLAQDACQRRGRRLCTASEWERACEGPLQHGSTATDASTPPPVSAGSCNNTDAPGDLEDLVVSGSQARCTSPYGVADMQGNAAEWTSTVDPRDATAHVVKGGSAEDGSAKTTCSSQVTYHTTAHYDLLGFRCCSEPRPPASAVH